MHDPSSAPHYPDALMDSKDTLFQTPPEKQFSFDASVASVFDDMLDRSIPFYKEALKLCTDFAIMNLAPDQRVYDLGCSTGTLLLELARKATFPLHLIGVDNAESMLERARQKASAYGAEIDFVSGDVMEYPLESAQVLFCNYLLQFVRPLQRAELVQNMHESLEKGGILILSEKVISNDALMHKQMIDLYYAFKKEQGYSELEIMQKREALENVLVPYTEQENRTMLEDAGFAHVETLFRWANFATYVARK